MTKLRLAVCPDFPEEEWPSMDRIAAMLIEYLRRDHLRFRTSSLGSVISWMA